MKTATKLLLAGAAVVAGTCLKAPASYAFGDAPWCAVIELGEDDVYWDCEYRTIEECVPNVIAGNRGSCTQNPWPGPATAAPGTQGRPRARHARHHHPRQP